MLGLGQFEAVDISLYLRIAQFAQAQDDHVGRFTRGHGRFHVLQGVKRAATHVGYPFREFRFDRFPDGMEVLEVGIRFRTLPAVGPAAVEAAHIVRRRSDNEQGLLRFDGQRKAVVFQQDDAFLRGLQGLARELLAAEIGVAFRIPHLLFVQAERHLYGKNPRDGLIYPGLLEFPGLHELHHHGGKVSGRGGHAHVHAGFDRHAHGFLQVARDFMSFVQVPNVLPVRHQQPLETHTVAQYVGEEMLIDVRRDTVDFPGVDHDGQRPAVDGGGVLGQVVFHELPLGEVGGRPVASA